MRTKRSGWFILKIKHLLSHPRLPLFACGLGLLFTFASLWTGWFADDYWHRLSYCDWPELRKIVQDDERLTGPMRAYSFFGGNEESIGRGQDTGIIPWWLDPNVCLNFWRPIAGCLLDIDYTLWPETPMMMHLHSLIWFAALLVLSALLFRNIMGITWAAGAAALLFAIDDSHAWPVGFLANRHILVAMFFGVLSIGAFDRWRKSDESKWGIVSLLAFVFSLLSSEGGVVVFGYLIAYLIFLDRKNFSDKIRSVIPFVLSIVIWRIVYNILGYGATGNELYIDPIREPVYFIGTAIERLPILLMGSIAYPPSDLYFFFSNQGLLVYSALSYLLLIIFAGITYPLWKQCRISQFWFCGMVFAAVPLCAALPGNRNLGFLSLGAFGAIAQILYHFLHNRDELIHSPLRRRFLWGLAGIGGMIHLIFSPVGLGMSPLLLKFMDREMVQALNFADWDERIETKDVIVLNSPMGILVCYLIPFRFIDRVPNPEHLRLLSSGSDPIHVKRIDDRTLSIRPDYGFLPSTDESRKPAGARRIHFGLQNFLKRFEWLLLRRDTRFQAGQTIQLTGLRIEIVSITDDWRPLEVRFHFDRILEDESLLWYGWDYEAMRFTDYSVPKIGQSAVIRP